MADRNIMGRKNISETRRHEIVEAFYETAKAEGLENVSIAKIAHKMGIQPSLIIYYYKTKEDLIFALIEFNLEKYSAIYRPGENGGLHAGEKLSKILDKLFSHEWNLLFDDGVFYSCYALTYRSDRIKKSYKMLHDSLRAMLAEAIEACNTEGLLQVEDVQRVSELIFIMVEGAYYYLGMYEDTKAYESKMANCKAEALKLLNFVPAGA